MFPLHRFKVVPRWRLALAAHLQNLQPAEAQEASALMFPHQSSCAGGCMKAEWREVTPRCLTHLLSPAAMATAVAGAVWDWRGRLVRSACPSLPLTGSSASLIVECSPVAQESLRMRQGFLTCKTDRPLIKTSDFFKFCRFARGLILSFVSYWDSCFLCMSTVSTSTCLLVFFLFVCMQFKCFIVFFSVSLCKFFHFDSFFSLFMLLMMRRVL